MVPSLKDSKGGAFFLITIYCSTFLGTGLSTSTFWWHFNLSCSEQHAFSFFPYLLLPVCSSHTQDHHHTISYTKVNSRDHPWHFALPCLCIPFLKLFQFHPINVFQICWLLSSSIDTTLTHPLSGFSWTTPMPFQLPTLVHSPYGFQSKFFNTKTSLMKVVKDFSLFLR